MHSRALDPLAGAGQRTYVCASTTTSTRSPRGRHVHTSGAAEAAELDCTRWTWRRSSRSPRPSSSLGSACERRRVRLARRRGGPRAVLRDLQLARARTVASPRSAARDRAARASAAHARRPRRDRRIRRRPETMRYIGTGSATREQARESLELDDRDLRAQGFGTSASSARRTESCRALGPQRLGSERLVDHETRRGRWARRDRDRLLVRPGLLGTGYATEAATAVRDWALASSATSG
jgi:hypothetical protein